MSSSAHTDQKGGFVQGLPQVSTLPVFSASSSGCCGSTDQPASAGCCGEPVTQVSLSTARPQATQGCCGEPTLADTPPAQAVECCGEPAATTAGITSVKQIGCCN